MVSVITKDGYSVAFLLISNAVDARPHPPPQKQLSKTQVNHKSSKAT